MGLHHWVIMNSEYDRCPHYWQIGANQNKSMYFSTEIFDTHRLKKLCVPAAKTNLLSRIDKQKS